VEATLEARHQLAGVIRQQKPRWLLAPYWVDAHPDHTAATELVEAARFWSKLTKSDLPGTPHHPERVFYYFCVHLRIVVAPAFVLDISPYWQRKAAAMACYESQFITGRPTEPPTFLDRQRDQAAYWGWSIGTQYGEPFASREPIGVSGMGEFV
jgi:LmbE family N-acetylglucosaminyl deacetylase